MLCNGIIDQGYKILKNHIDGDVTVDTIHFSTENTNSTDENKNTDSPFPLTQVTPNKSDKDPTLVTSDLENNATVLQQFLGHKKRQPLKHKVLNASMKKTKKLSD